MPAKREHIEGPSPPPSRTPVEKERKVQDYTQVRFPVFISQLRFCFPFIIGNSVRPDGLYNYIVQIRRNKDVDVNHSLPIVGLVPAAGYARRLSPLACSKEIITTGFHHTENGFVRPYVACENLFGHMRAANITRALIVLREGKWDIPTYLRDGQIVGIDLCYVVTRATAGAPHTLDKAYPFLGEAHVALGFPDILFTANNAFARLISLQAATNADVVLGLFPSDPKHASDRTVLSDTRIEKIIVKSLDEDLFYTWAIAFWTPRFTKFLHEYLSTQSRPTDVTGELYLGHIIQAAIEARLDVRGTLVSDKPFIDIGVPENLASVLMNDSRE